MNQKGEWGNNLPPSQMTVVNGEIWTPSEDKGEKRSGGRPPEPENPTDDESVEHVDHFEGQFRQRKRRKLAQQKNENTEKENTGIPELNNWSKNSVRDEPESSESGSRSV